MILYAYNKDTKELLGEFEANIDPLESEVQGKPLYVVPPFCTKEVPGAFKKGYTQIFENGWKYVEDHRGSTVYNKKTGVSGVVKTLGAITKEFSLEKPFLINEVKTALTTRINILYSEAQSRKIKIGKVFANIDDRISLKYSLNTLDELHPYCYFDMDEESVRLGEGEIKDIVEKLYERSLELPEIRNTLLKKVRVAKSKKALEELEVEIEKAF